MKVFTIILLLNSLFFIHSCIDTSCPPNEKIGEVSISDLSSDFFPYDNNPVLIFLDKNGNELKFISEKGVMVDEHILAIHDKCSELKFDGKTSYEYFEGQYKYIHFFSEPEGFSFTISIFTEVIEKDKELFYDRLLLDLSSVSYLGRGEMVIDYRGNSESEYKKNILIDYPLEYIDSITLNNNTYNNIYSTEIFENRQMYYNKKKGLVGFKYESKIYNLDRIE